MSGRPKGPSHTATVRRFVPERRCRADDEFLIPPFGDAMEVEVVRFGVRWKLSSLVSLLFLLSSSKVK